MDKFDDLFAEEFEVTLIREAQEVIYENDWRHRSVILECNRRRFTFFRLYCAGFFPQEQDPSLDEREYEHLMELPKGGRDILVMAAKKYLQSSPYHKKR